MFTSDVSGHNISELTIGEGRGLTHIAVEVIFGWITVIGVQIVVLGEGGPGVESDLEGHIKGAMSCQLTQDIAKLSVKCHGCGAVCIGGSRCVNVHSLTHKFNSQHARDLIRTRANNL